MKKVNNFYNQLIDLNIDPTEHFEGYIINTKNINIPLYYISNLQINNIDQLYLSIYNTNYPQNMMYQYTNDYYLDTNSLKIENTFIHGDIKYLIVSSKDLNDIFNNKKLKMILRQKNIKNYN